MTNGQDKCGLPDLATFLREARRAVLAPASGGCVQYLFSADVDVVPLANGEIGVRTPDRAEAQQRILRETTLSLRLPLAVDPDGTERRQLVLTGRLDTPPADGGPTRFIVARAHLADISGTVESIDIHRLHQNSSQ